MTEIKLAFFPSLESRSVLAKDQSRVYSRSLKDFQSMLSNQANQAPKHLTTDCESRAFYNQEKDERAA